MYSEWRDPHFFPEVVYSEARTEWVKNMPFNRCFVHAERGGEVETGRGGRHPGAVAARREVVRRTPRSSSAAWPAATSRGSATSAPAAPTSTTTRTSASSGSSPAKHPYKDTIIELDDIVGRLVAVLEETGQAEDTLIFLSSDNGPHMENWPDAAYTPFRSAKGSTWEGGVRVPGIADVAGDDRGRPGQRRAVQLHRPAAHDARAGRRRATASPTTGSSTASTRRSFLLGARRPVEPEVRLLLAAEHAVGRAGAVSTSS